MSKRTRNLLESGKSLPDRGPIRTLGCAAVALSLAVATSSRPTLAVETLGFSIADRSGNFDIRVVDELTQSPITDATIRLEEASPGSAVRNLTVSKAGYATITLMGLMGQPVTVYLKPIPTTFSEVMVSGQLTGFPPHPSSRTVQAGLVFRTMNAFDLLHFDTDALISPLRDTIDVMGPRRVPSNLVLPSQSVSYFLVSFELDKPDYRLPLPAGKESRLVGIQGEIDVRDLVPAMQN